MRTGFMHAGGVSAVEDAAFAHGDDRTRKLWDQPLAQAEIGFENGEIAVVDADDLRAVVQCAFEFCLIVDLKKAVEPCGPGVGEQYLDLFVVERAHDDKDRTSASFTRFGDLHGMN